MFPYEARQSFRAASPLSKDFFREPRAINGQRRLGVLKAEAESEPHTRCAVVSGAASRGRLIRGPPFFICIAISNAATASTRVRRCQKGSEVAETILEGRGCRRGRASTDRVEIQVVTDQGQPPDRDRCRSPPRRPQEWALHRGAEDGRWARLRGVPAGEATEHLRNFWLCAARRARNGTNFIVVVPTL